MQQLREVIALGLVVTLGACADDGTKSVAALDDLLRETDSAVMVTASKADSLAYPTVVGWVADGDESVGDFAGRSAYLAWPMLLEAGDEATITAAGADNPRLDTLLVLYRADSNGNPYGPYLTYNDDIDGGLSSRVEYTAEVAGAYVAIVRRYDRRRQGRVALSLTVQRPHMDCAVDADCGEAEFCRFEADANCGDSGAAGVCSPAIPRQCAQIYAPVCGCNGVTYGNACMAYDTSVAHSGECEPAAHEPVGCGARLGDTCADDEFCAFSLQAICGWADATGVCQPLPRCDRYVVSQVCGCDGRTYDTECFANASGVAIQRQGACDAPAPAEGDECDSDAACALAGSPADGLVCAGLSHADIGFCVPSWMRGHFDGPAPADVPDNDPDGVELAVEVRGLATVPTDIVVHLVIRHTWRADLRVTLTDPGGQTVVIVDRQGGSADDVIFDGPVGGFSMDDSVNGTWILTVSDHAGYDVGRVESWSLDLTSRWD